LGSVDIGADIVTEFGWGPAWRLDRRGGVGVGGMVVFMLVEGVGGSSMSDSSKRGVGGGLG
jgi:hypothetical protein